MATYLVGDVRVREPDKYKEYLVEVPKIAAKHGGKYLVRGGELTLNEGDWAPKSPRGHCLRKTKGGSRGGPSELVFSDIIER